MSREIPYKEFGKIIEAERAKMKAEVEVFDEEKKRMQSTVNNDEIIHLNIGGQKFTTKRSTLCQVEGSLLATMFSGRWEDSVERDQDGAVYFDFTPQYFAVILDYLRAKKITTLKNQATVSKVPEDQVKNFNILVEYLGLSHEMLPTEVSPGEKFNLHSPGVTLEDDQKVAIHDDTNWSLNYVLGKNIYQQGIVNFKLKLESFKNHEWIFIGIVKADVVPPNDYSHVWPGSYGWALGFSGRQEMWKNGSRTMTNAFVDWTKQGDKVVLILDLEAAKLLLHLPYCHQSHMDIPKNKTWRLNVGIYCPNDKIRIINQ